MTLKELGMTEEQAVYEIQFMREWAEFIKDELGKEKHDALCNKFSRKKVEEEMRARGIPEDEIKEVCDAADSIVGVEETDRLERIEKMCAEILVKVNRLDIDPLRTALNKCETPEEARQILNLYIDACNK